eukprot:ctg_681.g360
MGGARDRPDAGIGQCRHVGVSAWPARPGAMSAPTDDIRCERRVDRADDPGVERVAAAAGGVAMVAQRTLPTGQASRPQRRGAAGVRSSHQQQRMSTVVVDALRAAMGERVNEHPQQQRMSADGRGGTRPPSLPRRGDRVR